MKWFSRMSLIIFLLLWSAPGLASESSFEPLKQRYLSLRNTDPDVQRISEWKSLAQALSNFAEMNEKSADSPTAIFYSSILLNEIAVTHADSESEGHAVEQLERLVRDYPRSDLADDALVMLGDIHSGNPGEQTRSREYYERAVESYAESDMAEVARKRLSGGVEFQVSGENPEWNHVESTGERLRIMLDPGHGGEDRGAVGVGGLMEKDVTFSVALDLQKRLEALGYDVDMTREDDSFTPLAERTSFANGEQASVFISLHANASPGRKRSGLETYVLDTSHDDAARILAERENGAAAGAPAIEDLNLIVSDLIQKGKMDESRKLATLVHSSVLAAVRSSGQPLPDLGVRKGPFYVLVGAHMPCMLIEMGFIDNAWDGKLLADSAFRQDLSMGIAEGVDRFLKEKKSNERLR